MKGASLLHTAIDANCSTELVSCLLEHGGKKLIRTRTDGGVSAVYVAAAKGNSDTLATLLSFRRFKPDAHKAKVHDGLSPLHAAAFFGHFEAVKLLTNLTSAMVVDDHGLLPLHFGVQCGKTDIVKYLLGEYFGALVNNLYDGSMRTVYDTRKRKEKVFNNEGSHVLHFAASRNHYEIIKLLMDVPHIDADVQNAHGYTPLHEAARRGHLEAVKELTGNPSVYVDVNLMANTAGTPLHLSCMKGRLGVTRHLLTLPEIDVNIQDGNGWAPIHELARGGHLADMKLLTSLQDIDVDIETNSGDTALDLAKSHRRDEIVKYLSESCAS